MDEILQAVAELLYFVSPGWITLVIGVLLMIGGIFAITANVSVLPIVIMILTGVVLTVMSLFALFRSRR